MRVELAELEHFTAKRGTTRAGERCEAIGSMGPRSLHVVSSLRRSAGGPTESIVQLCQALCRAGAPAKIVTLESNDSIAPPPDVEVHFFPANWPKRLCRSSGLESFVQHETYDLVHVHGVWDWTGVHARCAARHASRPLVISPRGMLEPWCLKQKAWRKRIAMALWEQSNMKEAAMFHATAQAEADNLRMLGLKKPIAVVPNGVAFPAVPPKRNNSSRTVLFLSRIHPQKGVEMLLEAWARVVQLVSPGWTLELIGPIERYYRHKLEAIVMEKGILGSVRILGPKYGAEKWSSIRNAALFVLPSSSENFGNVVVEALSQGVPVITTKATPWEEIEVRGCGWWVQPEPEYIGRALLEALRLGEEKLSTMGAIGERWVRATFTPEAAATAMISHYKALFGSGLVG